jgi:hypothetical protein
LPGTLNVVSGSYADLFVEDFAGPGDAAVGQSIPVSWATRNGTNAGGATPVAAWHDRVVLSGDLVLGNADDRVVANIAHDGAVPVGGSYTVTTNVTLPSDVSGNWNLYLVTDPFNVVYESQYEGNNASTNQPITIRSPDLTLTEVTAPAVASPAGRLVLTVRNAGVVAAFADWSDRIYFSTQSAPDGSAISLATVSAAAASPLGR